MGNSYELGKMVNSIPKYNEAFENSMKIGLKNRLINGDFKVKQRFIGEMNNDSEYVIDRWKASAGENDKFWLEQSEIYSPDEGSLLDSTDPFGDGSLVAYYKLDGNANDETGNYDGTWGGDSQQNEAYVDGKFDKAAYFNGHSYINTGYKTQDLIDNRSFSLWVKANPSDNDSNVEFFGYRDAQNKGSLSLYWYNKDNTLQLVSSGGSDSNVVIFNGVNKIISSWMHIVGVYNDGTQTLYINGTKIGENSLGSDGDDNYSIYLGAANSNSKIVGRIDQVRFLDKALTQDEVKKLYVEDSKYFFKPHLREQVVSVDSDSPAITFLEQKIERHLIDDLIGNQVTLSFEISNNRNQDYKVSILYGDETEISNTTITTDNIDFKKYSVVFDLTNYDISKLPEFNECGLIVKIEPTDPQANDIVRFANVQLEKGDKVTDFEIRSYDDELKRCMRYYQIWKNNVFSNYAPNENISIYTPINLKVDLRQFLCTVKEIEAPNNIIGLNDVRLFSNIYGYCFGGGSSDDTTRTYVFGGKYSLDAEL